MLLKNIHWFTTEGKKRAWKKKDELKKQDVYVEVIVAEKQISNYISKKN